MSLYDDVPISDLGFGASSTESTSGAAATSSSTTNPANQLGITKTDSQNDIGNFELLCIDRFIKKLKVNFETF